MTVSHAGILPVRRGRARSNAVSPPLATDIAWLSLLLLTIVTISRVHQYVGIIGRLRPAFVLFVLAAAAAILQRRVRLGNLTAYWPGKLMIALGIFACISAPFGIAFGSSVNFIISNYAKTLLYAAMLIVGIRIWKDLSRLVWAFVIGAGILAFISVFIVGISKTQSNATFDANDVGLIMVVSIPLAIVTFQTSAKSGKILSLIVLVLSATTIARSLSRGAFVGLLVVGVGILFSLRTVSVVRRGLVMLTALAALLFTAPQEYWDLMQTLKNPTADYNWSARAGRKELAKRGLAYMLENPIFGLGIHNFGRAEGTISEHARNRLTGAGIRWAAPHNSFAEVGAELGIPGFLMWTGLVFGCMVGTRRLHRRLPYNWRTGDQEQRFLYSLTAGLPLAIAGFTVTSFFVSFAFLDPIYILVAMTCGTYICVNARLPHTLIRRPASNSLSRRRRGASFVGDPLTTPRQG